MLEYNGRFGDPETQAVLPRLRSDLLELLEASTRPGGLAGVEPEWSADWAVTVVLASRGYPESSSAGDVISGLDEVRGRRGLPRRHRGARRRDRHRGRPRAGRDRAGRRRRPRRASAPTPPLERIDFDGRQMRRDIAARAVR